jgi:hypothetical protein
MTFAPVQNRLGVQPVGTAVTCVNKSGGTLAIGDLVITSFIHAGAVVDPQQAANTGYVFNCIRKATTLESGNSGYLGVVTGLMAGAGANGREVEVQFGGICQAKVLVNATVSSGTLLGVSATAGVLSNAVSTSEYSVTLMDNAAVADGTALKRVYIPTEYSFNTATPVSAGQFLRDALSGIDSVDILIAGDSNTNKNGWGWCDGLNFALQQRNAVDYATPIVPVFSRESATFYGVNSFFNSFGYINDTVINTPAGTTGSTVNLQIGSAANSPELYALLSRSSGLFQPNAAPFNYGYIPTGTWCDWNGGISLYDEASPYPVLSWLSSELRYRVVYGAGPGMGTLRLIARLDGAPYSAIGSTVVTNCNQATWEWKVATKTVTAATRTAASKFGYADITADATASITGPMALALQSVSRPIKGFAVQSICHYGGANMDTVSADAAGAALVIKAYMKEARERQISCTGTGRVIVMIQGGLNTGVNPWATSAKSFRNTCQTQWSALGYPMSDLAFVGLVSHQDDTPDSDAADRTSAATLTNIYNIYDGKNLASYAELLAGDSVGTYFANASTERNHLNQAGYKFICGRLVSALLSY